MSRRIVASAIVSLGLVGLLNAGDPERRPVPTRSKPDRSFGTAIQWESSMEKAAKLAERQDKLVMVLAVAGHFEDPFFT